MRIGVDARELCGRPTGVGRYLAGLLREWQAAPYASGHEFVLYAPDDLGISLDTRRFPTRVIPGSTGTWWEQMRLPRAIAEDQLDLFFAPAYTAPLRTHVPTVLTIHDLSYVAHPEWFRMREGTRRRLMTRASARRAAMIITVSEFSKREIAELLGVDTAKIRVVPQGIEAPHIPAERNNPSPAAYEPRILYVGSIFNRRRVPDLIRAVAALARRHPTITLDIVGDNRTFPREDIDRSIAIHAPGGGVRWHRYVSDEQLRELYARARAFAFLSEYEGLGMTPLEALASGLPPVVLDSAVARESLGDAAVYAPLDPDIPAIVRALETALFDESVRARVLDAAPRALEKYDWRRAAKETISVFESAARGIRA
jgi:glycosyltransferase involved in cell wall biosynthesis